MLLIPLLLACGGDIDSRGGEDSNDEDGVRVTWNTESGAVPTFSPVGKYFLGEENLHENYLDAGYSLEVDDHECRVYEKKNETVMICLMIGTELDELLSLDEQAKFDGADDAYSFVQKHSVDVPSDYGMLSAGSNHGNGVYVFSVFLGPAFEDVTRHYLAYWEIENDVLDMSSVMVRLVHHQDSDPLYDIDELVSMLGGRPEDWKRDEDAVASGATSTPTPESEPTPVPHDQRFGDSRAITEVVEIYLNAGYAIENEENDSPNYSITLVRNNESRVSILMKDDSPENVLPERYWPPRNYQTIGEEDGFPLDDYLDDYAHEWPDEWEDARIQANRNEDGSSSFDVRMDTEDDQIHFEMDFWSYYGFTYYASQTFRRSELVPMYTSEIRYYLPSPLYAE